jgi:hypothetical protein
MSESQASFDWVVSLGAVLGIIVSVSVVAGAAYKIVTYLRKKVTHEAEQTRWELTSKVQQLQTQLLKNNTDARQLIEEKVQAGTERNQELKYWMEKMERYVENNKKEMDETLARYRQEQDHQSSARMGETAKLLEYINDLKDKHYRLSLQLAKLKKNNNHGDDNNNNIS